MRCSLSLDRRRPRMRKIRRMMGRLLIYAALFAGAAIIMIPLAWLVSTALGTEADALRIPHVWLPWPPQFENFHLALTKAPFHIYFANTVQVTLLGVVGTLLSTSLVAFGFARRRFPGRETAFLCLLCTLMIPGQVLMVPRFILFRDLGWYDTLLPLIVPQWFATDAMGVFLFRQFYKTIPPDFDEAARLDGANSLQIWSRVLLPLSKPVLATLGVLCFLGNWNDFMGPLIYTLSPDKQTFALALAALPGQFEENYHLAMAATLAFMTPSVLLFFAAQRHLLHGLSVTGMGGK